MIHATTNWNRADNSIHRVLAASLRIVANVAAHGMYSRQKIIRQKALSCPKPAAPRIPTSVSIPAAELILGTPQDGAAGYHHFFRGNTGNQSDGNLPEP